ncbi:uncharacterized protein [Nicotiana sylvestris]|uniref:uncharacterized protein n=1 Tax=Nicotiana sylvestris TaxID=4096 RepID=UPI00388C5D63
MDYVIIKSRTQDDHVRDLRKFFERLHKYDLKLDLAKCAFGVPSRKLWDSSSPLSTYFPDKEVNSVEVTSEDTNAWKTFFNGVVNAKGVGIGAILISPTGQHYPTTARLWSFCTNNTAKYEAYIIGMNMAIDQDVEGLIIMGDLDLIIRQAQGEWETRDVKLIPYNQHVEDLSKWFKSVEFRYIPHFHNELADALATLASMLPYPGNVHIVLLEIQIRERHGYCNTVEVEPNVQPWYHDIKRFLKMKEYPEQANGDQKRTIKRLANGFFLSRKVLYKRTPDLSLLRCVDAEEAGRNMHEVHIGVCAPHINGYVLAKKIIRAGYYWMTMEKDCFSFARKCHQCQVEAVTLKAITKKAVVDFVHSNIICRFDISTIIILDNATNLNSHLMREIWEQFKITHRNSIPYRPKANGALEAANKNIKKIIRKMIQSSRQRYEKLPFALLGYRAHQLG